MNKKKLIKNKDIVIHEDLFILLQKKGQKELLELLKQSYCNMNSEQRTFVFGKLITEAIKETKLSTGKEILNKVKEFQYKSLNRYYYAPFEINSKNYMDLPE